MSSNVFANKYLWVWLVNRCGGAERVVNVAKKLGYGLCVKYHDGDPADDWRYGFRPNFEKVAEAAQRVGVPLLAWGYCYGDLYGNLEKEVKAAVETQKLGAIGYVIDAESEWERNSEGAEWAKRFMQRFKELAPDYPVAYTTFWNLRWHPRFPAKAFVDGGCQASLPQVYFGLAARWSPTQQYEMLQIALEDFGKLPAPVYPVGEANRGVRPGDLLNFLQLVKDRPHSLWRLDELDESFQEVLLMKRNQAIIEELKAWVSKI